MVEFRMRRRRLRSLENRDRVSRRAGGADDRERREYVGENPGLALDEPLERHAFMEMNSVLPFTRCW